MRVDEIVSRLMTTYPGLQRHVTWGEVALFYNPGSELARGIYFVTFKDKDSSNDSASFLDRGDLFRMNLGLSKPRYRQLFGDPPVRPPAGGIVATGHDFTTIDKLLPHPVYAWMSWVCIISPRLATVDELVPFFDDSYALCKYKHASRTRPKRATAT